MKPDRREIALKAHQLAAKNVGFAEIAARLKLADRHIAADLVQAGRMIAETEAFRLTDREWLVMKTLARMEARRAEIGCGSVVTSRVDFAARQRSGWCAYVVSKRLRERRDDDGTNSARLNFVHHGINGHIWLTSAGWAFVWATKLIKSNWRVPA